MREHEGLPYRHRAGVSPYTSSYELAETCVFNKQSLPPILCQGVYVCSYIRTHVHTSPLIPKLRGHFAEFLQQGYLKALVCSTRRPVVV